MSAYHFKGHEGDGPAKCQHCPDEAFDGCPDRLCVDCCAKNGRDNGDGFACEACFSELVARNTDARIDYIVIADRRTA